MPISIQPSGDFKLYVFRIPATGPLGDSATDFGNVQVSAHSLNTGTHQANPEGVFFASTGKLGALSGGLLHTADEREALTAEEVKQMHILLVEENLKKKRTGWPLLY